jgi:hypothetical protein
MVKKYRVILSNDNRWVTRASSIEQARAAALVKCPDLELFGVHIVKIELVEPVEPVELAA